jgi:exodeoxyribonuclease VII small subunit
MTEKAVGDMTFEEAMAELERVVSQLESGNVDLEKSITLYERGAKLKAHCEKKLNDAQEKVATLVLDANGQPKGTTPVEGL